VERNNFYDKFIALCCEKKKTFQLGELEGEMEKFKRTGETNN
jgi:hypothetical protein